MSRTFHRARAGRTRAAGLVAATTGALLLPVVGGSVAQAAPVGATAELSAPVYVVLQEGLTVAQGEELAKRTGIGNALRPDGSFAYVDAERFGRVPASAVARGRDEAGRRTVSEAIDFDRLAGIKTLDADEARRLASDILPVPAGYGVRASIDHTTLDRSDRRGNPLDSYDLDTTVSYQLTLDGLPVIGPGAKARASFAGDGSVIQLGSSVRAVKKAGDVPIISPEQAEQSCTALYGPKVKQQAPVLGYYAPALTAVRGSGEGTVKQLLPQYVCRPAEQITGDSGTFGKLVAATPDLAPAVSLKASGDGRTVVAGAEVKGGTAPYTYRWSSSSVALDPEPNSAETSYSGGKRSQEEKAVETLTVTVTDADGLTTTAHVDLPELAGTASAAGVQGGAGGAFAENGIEQTVDEWQCAQDSADGFRSVMQSKGHSVNFDWRGAAAWERDFKDVNQGGGDSDYVDEVDAQWYTGHGWSGGFTFKGNHDDTSIVPGDARWGDLDLEWLQLESCQVLRDTNGSNDYFGRWGQAFRGLHLMNGFDTNAYCIGGGTGGRFANYLFPETFLWWTTRPALTVQQAWASMANDLEPAGVRWRSMSPATTGWVTNLGDHYWGQGSVGPDIRPGSASNPLIGYVSVSGVA